MCDEALHYACESGNIYMVGVLINISNIKSLDYYSLKASCSHDHKDIFRLLEYKIEIPERILKEYLRFALIYGNRNIYKYIRKKYNIRTNYLKYVKKTMFRLS